MAIGSERCIQLRSISLIRSITRPVLDRINQPALERSHMNNEDLNGRDEPDYGCDTCLETGKKFLEMDHYNIATDGGEDWRPFINESAWRAYMGRIEVSR